MAKRDELGIIKDILKVIRDNRNCIKRTHLLRKSNLSSKRFAKYKEELLKRELIKKVENKKSGRKITITGKEMAFLKKYRVRMNFVEEFNL